MTGARDRGQALVEFALIAPVMILLAIAVWDGGSILREQVILQAAARDGARVAATAYGPQGASTLVTDAVIASAADLPGLRGTVNYLTVSYPDSHSVRVRVAYAHTLLTPVLRELWAGGSGTVLLEASATFYLPPQTPVPATLPAWTATPTPLPSTPTPTATATATLSPTPTSTLTPTPSPSIPRVCTLAPGYQPLPALGAGQGYWCTLTLSTPNYLLVNWSDNADTRNVIAVYSGTNPFASGQDPTTRTPPTGSVATDTRAGSLWSVTGCLTAGTTQTLYFYNGGSVQLAAQSAAVIWQSGCGSGGG